MLAQAQSQANTLLALVSGERYHYLMAQQKSRRKDAAAVALAKKRAAKLSPEQRREIARKAAQTRWRKKRPTS